MFYLIHGKDSQKRKQKKDQLLEMLEKKRPASEVFTLDPENFENSALDELLFSQGLFDEKHIVWGSELFTHEETKYIFGERLEDIKNSPNVFVLMEKTLPAAQLKKISTNAEKVFDVGGEAPKAKQDNSVFVLADALGEKNKKKLWVEYQKAREKDPNIESLHGILFWQVKNMILAKNTQDAKEAGLKDFPYRKAKAFSKNYTNDELYDVSRELVEVYHDAHRGKYNIKDGLEQFILKG